MGQIGGMLNVIQSCAAAEASHVDHLVRSLPDGYDTLLTNGGEPLSQGQRQQITIARAQLAGRPVLILDEATSSVDSRTEVQVRQAMQRLRKGKAGFVIAHRLSTVRDADLIWSWTTDTSQSREPIGASRQPTAAMRSCIRRSSPDVRAGPALWRRDDDRRRVVPWDLEAQPVQHCGTV